MGGEIQIRAERGATDYAYSKKEPKCSRVGAGVHGGCCQAYVSA